MRTTKRDNKRDCQHPVFLKISSLKFFLPAVWLLLEANSANTEGRGIFDIKVPSCKLCNNKYMITSTEKTIETVNKEDTF